MAQHADATASSTSAIKYYVGRNPYAARDALSDLAKRANVSEKHLRAYFLTNSHGALFREEVNRVIAVVVASTDFNLNYHTEIRDARRVYLNARRNAQRAAQKD